MKTHKIQYINFTIEVQKGKTASGDTAIHYAIFKPNKELLAEDDLSSSNINEVISDCKYMIDDYLINPEQYD